MSSSTQLTEPMFVFGTGTSTEFGDPTDVLVVSTLATWQQEGCMDDQYEENVRELLGDSLREAGLNGGELVESVFELASGQTPVSARATLQAHPLFVHDPAFEKFGIEQDTPFGPDENPPSVAPAASADADAPSRELQPGEFVFGVGRVDMGVAPVRVIAFSTREHWEVRGQGWGELSSDYEGDTWELLIQSARDAGVGCSELCESMLALTGPETFDEVRLKLEQRPEFVYNADVTVLLPTL